MQTKPGGGRITRTTGRRENHIVNLIMNILQKRRRNIKGKQRKKKRE